MIILLRTLFHLSREAYIISVDWFDCLQLTPNQTVVELHCESIWSASGVALIGRGNV